MTDIGLVETSSHWHILYYLARIANTEQNNVTIFTTPDIHDRIAGELEEEEYDELTWVLKDDKEKHRQFLNRIERATENIDFLMINTLRGHLSEMFNFIRFNPRCASTIWIYNVNAWLRRRPVLGLPLDTHISKNLKMLLRPYILKNFDAINVEYSVWKRYIKEETSYSGLVFSLTPTLYEPFEDSVSGDDTPFTVTIPGSISSSRNYELALDAFETVEERNHRDTRLIILGRPPESSFADHIISRCKSMKNNGLNVVYYEEWIPQAEFNDALRNTDVILAPIEEERDKRETYEYVGTTAGTGLIFDALRNARPIVLPSFYPIGTEIDGMALHYDGRQGLADCLTQLANDPNQLKKLKSTALERSKQFDLANQRDEFEQIVERVMTRYSK